MYEKKMLKTDTWFRNKNKPIFKILIHSIDMCRM